MFAISINILEMNTYPLENVLAHLKSKCVPRQHKMQSCTRHVHAHQQQQQRQQYIALKLKWMRVQSYIRHLRIACTSTCRFPAATTRDIRSWNSLSEWVCLLGASVYGLRYIWVYVCLPNIYSIYVHTYSLYSRIHLCICTHILHATNECVVPRARTSEPTRIQRQTDIPRAAEAGKRRSILSYTRMSMQAHPSTNTIAMCVPKYPNSPQNRNPHAVLSV